MKKYRYFAGLIYFILLVSFVSSTEISPNKLVIQEFDYFKCRESNTWGKDIIPDIYFNTSSSDFFYKNLNIQIDEEKDFTQDYDYNSRVHENLPENIRYRVINKGVTYHLTTDGVWWTIYAILDIEGKPVEELGELVKEIKYNIEKLKETYSWVRERNLHRNEGYPQVNCHMSSTYQEDDVLLSIYNFFEYTGKINCIYDTKSIFSDCSNSDFYNVIADMIWEKKSYDERVSYKMHRNFIFLDKTDMDFENEDSFNKYGNQIVVSESQFSSGFSSSQSSFVYQFGYVREIEEIPYKINEIEKKNEDIKNQINVLNQRLVDAKNIWLEKDKNPRKQVERIQNLASVDVDHLNEYRSFLDEYKKILNQKKRLVKENPTTFYEDYYSNIVGYYLTNLKTSIEELESNIALYQNRIDYLRSYTSEITSYLVSEQARVESAAITDFNLRVAIFAILISICIFIFNFGYNSWNHWSNQIDLMKTIVDDLNEIAKTSESYKDLFIQKILVQYKHPKEAFKQLFDDIFKDYKDLATDEVFKNGSKLKKLIQDRIANDLTIALKIKSFITQIQRKGENTYESYKPQYYLKQLNFDHYTKQLDYKISILFYLKSFKTRPIKKLIHELSDLISVMNYQVENYYESGNHNKLYQNIFELDQKILDLFNELIKNEVIKKYWDSSKEKMKKLQMIIKRC